MGNTCYYKDVRMYYFIVNVNSIFFSSQKEHYYAETFR
jgi:hypothetical protein